MINELKETHNQNVDQQNGFHHLLDEMGIPYVEDDAYLHVGSQVTESGWILYLSVRSQVVEEMIRRVLPILLQHKVSFGFTKSLSVAKDYNDFWRGIDYVGKIMTIYSINEVLTKHLIYELSAVVVGMEGPQINNAIRLNESVYVARIFSQPPVEGIPVIVTGMPPIKKLPFKVDPKYRYWKRKRLLKNRYVPLFMVVHSPKGDLLKSVDLKGLKFNWCFIKEGKKRVFLDRNGRDIKDRLRWQAKALSEVQDHINVPKVIDFFEQGEECYLVMEWLEGVDLGRKIDELRKDVPWVDVTDSIRRQLMTYYIKALQMMEKMHAIGYVHRDATAANFMILASGEVYTIDLELSYNYVKGEPAVPFSLGAFGYVGPEQIREESPTVKEDVFTLGALMIHIVTGVHPSAFISKECEIKWDELLLHVPDVRLMSLIRQCLDMNPGNRPVVAIIRETIENIFFK
ncbi:serine/threonine protein kinase [Chitinophaga qingshengii]|uniref:Protein kinase n=1 Tax=Chitinophaga qingshengii TaxID=1569794 RepID=A0ABR7TGR9_9BACT|nr:protein kinase [Chitinophaga qingshengii]MBC9929103.1 protein kinase [Chitinophaga qingshengii]